MSSFLYNVYDGIVFLKLLFGHRHLRQCPLRVDVKAHGDRVFVREQSGFLTIVLKSELLGQLRNLTGWIVEITKKPCPSRADVDTGRYHTLRNPVIAKVALGDTVFCGVFTGDKQFVEVSGTVETGFDTLATTGTQRIFVQDQAVRALVCGPSSVSDLFAVRRNELSSVFGIFRAFLEARWNLVLFVPLTMVAESG
jgi:hypothetical protein